MKKASAPIAVEAPPGPHLKDWNLLRSFLAIYETGTLTHAAIRLASTQPNMGRHLRELEAHLGETLFVRKPGKLEATERAHALFAAVAPMATAIRDAERVLTGEEGQVVGVVRVAVSEVFGYHVVPQLLAPLLHEQPQLEVELSVSNHTDNLLRRDADIAVRFFRPDQNDIIARKLGSVEFGLFAHQDYIDRFGEPKGYEIAEGGFVAGFDKDIQHIGPSIHGARPTAPLRFRFRSDFALARQAVVECGGGIAMLELDVAASRPNLKRVLREKVGLKQEVWLCAHEELRRSSRMRFVWDRLGAALEERLSK